MGKTLFHEIDRICPRRLLAVSRIMFDPSQTDSLLSKVFGESAEGILITDADGRIVRVNPAFMTDSGYTAEELLGANPRIMKSGVHEPDFYEEMWLTITSEGRWRGEVWDRKKNGEIYAKWLSISAIRDDAGQITHYVGIHQDITRRKQTEAHLEQLAHYDTLTTLPNRVLFYDRLRQAISQASRNGQQVAVLFVDLDGFKNVNDSLGHRAGDRLLMAVGRRFREAIRVTDTVARFGGDEFTLALPAINTLQSPAAVSRKLLETLSKSFRIEGHEVRISASIGIAMYPFDGTEPEVLFKAADTAMYVAKRGGKNRYQFYSASMHERAVERFKLESELRNAIDNDELKVYYQPQIDAKTGRVVSVEALIRWQHPSRGLLLPGEFLPVAEESGLIVPIGELVIGEACRQAARWQERGGDLRVWVNMSADQFLSGNLFEMVQGAIEASGADPRYIGIEVTEGTMMKDVAEATAMLERVTALGVEVAIDDFGTGYSSLSYLASFPLSCLKIPYEFVSRMVEDEGHRKITESIIAMARGLGLKVVAEGVERDDQLELLRNNGCDLIQGFLYSRAIEPEAICSLIGRCGDPPKE